MQLYIFPKQFSEATKHCVVHYILRSMDIGHDVVVKMHWVGSYRFHFSMIYNKKCGKKGFLESQKNGWKLEFFNAFSSV